jgi:YVTN family beta-propeller protein/VCBS repeat-containing protein
MGYAGYIGRVGALAVVLGVGVAVTSNPGVVIAEPTESGPSDTGSSSTASTGATASTGTTSSTGAESATGVGSGSKSAGSSTSTTTSGTSSTPVPASSASSTTATPSIGSTVSDDPRRGIVQSSGGAHTASSIVTDGGATTPASSSPLVPPESPRPRAGAASSSASTPQASSSQNAPASTVNNRIGNNEEAEQPAPTRLQPPAPMAAVLGAPDASISTLPVEEKSLVPEPVETSPPQPQQVPALIGVLMAPLNVLMTAVANVWAWFGAITGVPGAPMESPLMLFIFGWMRRQSQQSLVDEVPAMNIAPVTTSQTVGPLSATGVDQQLTALADVGTPDPVTGAVSGSLNTTGAALSYTLTEGPQLGSVKLNADGTYVYTPSNAARLAAGQTMGVDLDSFTVAASDGQVSETIPVSVPVTPANLAVSSEAARTGMNPAGVAIVGDRAYVANQSSNSVSVIDISASTPTLLATVPVGYLPTGVAAAGADGSRVYVTNAWSNTVSVIDTTTPTPSVVATIPVGSVPTGVAVSPYGSRAYVVNTYSGTVSVIDTALNRVVATVRVGYLPGGIGISPDGTRLYVTNNGGWSVSVIDTTTSTPAVVATVMVGAAPTSVAVSGTRAFVANASSNTVSVLDTTASTPTVLATVAVGPAPTSIILSADGSAAFVANSNDTLSVIDVASNRILRTVQADPSGEWGTHSLALSTDGARLYMTDGSDWSLRSMSLVTGTQITTGVAPLTIPGSGGYTVSATWYFPNKDEPPAGVIYLQHGFFRTSANVSALAYQLADQTNSIVVTPTLSSNFFDPYNVWGVPIQQAVASMFSGDRSELTASASAAAGHAITLPDQFVLAGHSAGGELVSAAAGYMADNGAIDNLKAVILFDTTDSGQGRIGLAKLTGANTRPVYLIAAQPCACNSYGAHAYNILTSPPTEFVAVTLDGGSHLDAEGATTDWYAELFCGLTTVRDATALQSITASWINHVFTGSPDDVVGPLGTAIAVDGVTTRVIGVSDALAA